MSALKVIGCDLAADERQAMPGGRLSIHPELARFLTEGRQPFAIRGTSVPQPTTAERRGYSWRRTEAGSIRKARRAGKRHATTATKAMTSATDPRMCGSFGAT